MLKDRGSESGGDHSTFFFLVGISARNAKMGGGAEGLKFLFVKKRSKELKFYFEDL